MKKSIIVAIILVVIVIAGFVLFRLSEETATQPTLAGEQVTNGGQQTSDEGATTNKQAITGKVVEIDLTAKQWEFSPQLIEVNLGDKVELHIESEDVTHGIIIPEYGISERLTPGEDIHVEFTADKKGTFNFLCNVPCGRGHGGMNGIIVVK